MNLRGQRRHDDIEIFITPFVDVLLVLLLFFVVTTTFVRNSEIELTLPEAARELPKTPVELIEVEIDRSGRTFINGGLPADDSVEGLRAALTAAIGSMTEPVVVIRADENTTHQSVISVMDAARRAGLTHITFATRVRDQAR